ncbi:MAG: hypothetical protein V3V96_15360 [Acidiferrobacterales bacterium]
MIMDKNNEFADAVEVTLAAGTNLIGDVLDLGVNRDIGQARLYLIVQVDTAFAGGTAMQFVLASDAQAAIATSGAETRHFGTDVLTDAQLTAGFTQVYPLPMGDTAQGEDTVGYERYLGVLGIGTGTHTAGKVNLFLTLDPYGWTAHPDGNK